MVLFGVFSLFLPHSLIVCTLSFQCSAKPLVVVICLNVGDLTLLFFITCFLPLYLFR